MTTSTTSYQSSGFYPSDHLRYPDGIADRKSPLPPGVMRSAADDAVIHEMNSKIIERREERTYTSTTSSTTEQQQSKWEYVGQGIWENGEPKGGGGPPSPPIRQKQRPADTLNLASSLVESSTTTSSMRERQAKASSATQELDDLMQTLNTFKLKETATDEPAMTNLDDMLDNLQENMVKQGVKTTQKGVCFACEKPIVGQVVTALGKTFHPEHFTCAHCNQV